ncbi:class I SAM-dependent methyltransferase [Conexibacter sp. JD483]|uniref:class I SAM-dependent methyltransferase n=1 Tax=unclassified Conexibacter TaxID=2627773 RepID=UPI00271A6A2F|nr:MULTISPECIES: class I SAM-dependent methyltransferase [unclassified Conexibacter]MDO8188970.1 class I SAM-dependent methyltransferase [Conexibacter sp. CPCC 205706]MDO8201778.1 class I SAM-dependent methyltransferase [Conexibacter sp. CPCC 205762]MDR9371443.1 class I SAM-dependent methyltransferase [Conexibacter sp. JD483]
MPNEQHETNRASWNAATARHMSHRDDAAVLARLQVGEPILFPEELGLLGNLRGLRVLHLQCNDGLDTLALAREGAAEVVGVDISDVAVATASRRGRASGLPVRFERGDVLDWMATAAAAGERFDRVFASYGALCWIADLDAWMRGAAALLAPGGRLVVVEFHPLFAVFEPGWVIERSYFGAAGGWRFEEGIQDYVGYLASDPEEAARARAWVNPNACVEFQWTVGAIVSAVLGAGMRLEALQEHPYANGWQPFPEMRGDDQRRFHPPAGRELPMMVSLAAGPGA